jgi:hypothetical protein
MPESANSTWTSVSDTVPEGGDFELGAEVTGRLARCPEGHRSVGGAVFALCIVRPSVGPDLVRLSDEFRAAVAVGCHPVRNSGR